MTDREPNRESEPPATERCRNALLQGGVGRDRAEDLGRGRSEKSKRTGALVASKRGGSRGARALADREAPHGNGARSTIATSPQLGADCPTALSTELPREG